MKGMIWPRCAKCHTSTGCRHNQALMERSVRMQARDRGTNDGGPTANKVVDIKRELHAAMLSMSPAAIQKRKWREGLRAKGINPYTKKQVKAKIKEVFNAKRRVTNASAVDVITKELLRFKEMIRAEMAAELKQAFSAGWGIK